MVYTAAVQTLSLKLSGMDHGDWEGGGTLRGEGGLGTGSQDSGAGRCNLWDILVFQLVAHVCCARDSSLLIIGTDLITATYQY